MQTHIYKRKIISIIGLNDELIPWAMHLYKFLNNIFLLQLYWVSSVVSTCFAMRLILFFLIHIWPFCVQGAKGSSPTFSMKRIEEGHYAIDFHAQLSALQAFSICVAILHGTSPFSSAGQEKNQQLSQCSSVKMLIEEDVDFFFNSVTTEKKAGCKNQKATPRSYVLNPPFSPIARV